MSGATNSFQVLKNPRTGADGKVRKPSLLKAYVRTCFIKLIPLALSLYDIPLLVILYTNLGPR